MKSNQGVEYRLTAKGQELVESVIHLLNWMKNGLIKAIEEYDSKDIRIYCLF